MKWIFSLFVLLNVALYMWGSWYHKPLVDIEPPQPRPNVATDKMKLVSEPGVELSLRPPPRAQAPVGVEQERCYQLGPFATLDKARAASGKLDMWGVPHTRVAEFETLRPAYRVYLPPLATKEAAERRRRELTKLGFGDHALITDEAGLVNGISLGLFAVERNARARMEQLARKGVNASLQPLANVQPVYWLTLATPAVGEQIGETPLERFRQEPWGATNVDLRSTRCERSRTPAS